MKPSSSYKLWSERLEGDTLSRGQVTQFCNAIAAGAYGFIIGGHRTNLTAEECSKLMDQFYERGEGYKLTSEHSEFGYQWLRDSEKRARACGVSEKALDTFKEFRFVGVKIVGINDFASRATIIPVYRVLSDEPPVDYSWSAWQSRAYT